MICKLTRSLTKEFRKPFMAYLGPSLYFLPQKINSRLLSAVAIQPFVFSRYRCSFCGDIPTNIEIVYYEEIKNLPNHPEILLIDVREPDEIRQTGKIPTSINIPLSRVQNELGKSIKDDEFKRRYSRNKPSTNTIIIFHCRSGRRSQEASECAVALGYKNVKNYKGSWNDWAEHEGLPH